MTSITDCPVCPWMWNVQITWQLLTFSDALLCYTKNTTGTLIALSALQETFEFCFISACSFVQEYISFSSQVYLKHQKIILKMSFTRFPHCGYSILAQQEKSCWVNSFQASWNTLSALSLNYREPEQMQNEALSHCWDMIKNLTSMQTFRAQK